MEALNDLVRSGKVRYIGASSMYAWQFAKAQHVAEKNGWAKFVSMQDLYNLIYREEEREMIPLCLDQGVGLIPWSPLARGLLSGKTETTTRSQTDGAQKRLFGATKDQDSIIIERVKEVATKRENTTPSQVAIAWLLSKPAVVAPIVGVNKIEYLEQLVAAVHQVKLTEEEIKYLEEVYQPKRVVGFV
eukprot:GEZU01015127.1.p2 GENE.GEZU01015127.1~~GEZU01015127.1.p2  ORF type:complete len:188 (-),score=69.07 GEZU01015127.1:65-628(-)